MNILNESGAALGNLLREGEYSFIELSQSSIHKCEMEKNHQLIFFVTPENKLKCITNLHSPFCLPISQEVKCCMWCGFEIEKTKHKLADVT
jgi:hypothetical protein